MLKISQQWRTETSGAPGKNHCGASPWWWCATSVATLFALVRVALVALLPFPRAVGLFEDDAFYYFGIAAHLAAGDGSTFNGIDLTNGYHPLWQGLLVPVFAISSDRAALVLVTILSAVLYVSSAALLDRLAVETGRPRLVIGCALPLLALGAAGPDLWFAGMETGVLLLALSAVALIFVRSGGLRAPWWSMRHSLGFGLLMSAVVLSRLDAVFPMLLLGAVALAVWRRRPIDGFIRLTLALAAGPVVVLGGYLAANRWVFGTALPVSGQAKALGGGGFNIEVLHQFLAAPVIFGTSTWLGGLAVLAVPAAVLLARRSGPTALGRSARFGLIVLLGGLATALYYALTSSWQLWPWYFYASPFALSLSIPALLASLRGTRRLTGLAVVTVICATALVGVNAVRQARSGPARAAYVEQAPEVAAALRMIAPGVPVAMGDRAGSFGYHLDAPLVHLEGLVNSAAYLDALRDGKVGRFLAEHRVGVYGRVDADRGIPFPTADGVCRQFTEPQQGGGPKAAIMVCDRDLVLQVSLADGTSYRFWRYHAELNRT
jgi:hypothetical protein